MRCQPLSVVRRQHFTTYIYQVAVSHILLIWLNGEVHDCNAHQPHEFVPVSYQGSRMINLRLHESYDSQDLFSQIVYCPIH
jgi:hypothetical protein